MAMGAVRGDPRTGAVFLTNPPSAEIWWVSVFAFRVCQRTNADPWERLGCRWNEIQSGTEKPLSGRFVYQVRWPDGTVRERTREIAPFDDELFKKVGS
ncbi:MAG: hypothetical protein JNL35_03535 [Sphingopyxis sp.]|nr:hypothetical protein [Sphingopyxis sp.]